MWPSMAPLSKVGAIQRPCQRQLSAFRRRQPDLLVLPTLSPTDVAMLIAAEVEKRGYEGVGSLEARSGLPAN